jgi:hypothetical protein
MQPLRAAQTKNKKSDRGVTQEELAADTARTVLEIEA